jgi:GH15 family glucan-1,4-alpha-glucosidase
LDRRAQGSRAGQAHKAGMPLSDHARALRQAILQYLAKAWRAPDDGLWEMRDGPQLFVHSKVMAWVAFDRVSKQLEAEGLDEEARWCHRVAGEIHAEICERGFDREQNSFVQTYGSKKLDASLLLIPLVGFLPASDPRVRGPPAPAPDGSLVVLCPCRQGLGPLQPPTRRRRCSRWPTVR